MKTEEIIKHGVLIGSRAYGVNKDNTSDYDLVVTEEDYYKVCENNDAVSCNTIDQESSEDGYDYSIFGSGLDGIAKFTSDDGDTINVFIFTDEVGNIENRVEQTSPRHIYDRFKLHNDWMNKHSNNILADRVLRIERFIQYLSEAGITEVKH